MTVEDAEAFYKKYLGHEFHMGREEWSKYKSLQQLNLPNETFVKWDNDLLSNEFEKMWDNPEKVWARHVNILDILARGRCSYEAEVSHLLDEMEKMKSLSTSCRTLIIENMAGRTESQKDGGVWLICSKTKQMPRMKQIMAGLIQDEASADQRFKEAVQRYEKALRRYGRK